MEIHARQNLGHFGRHFAKAKLFCQNIFLPVTQVGVVIWEIFFPVTEISIAKNETSVTGPARLLI